MPAAADVTVYEDDILTHGLTAKDLVDKYGLSAHVARRAVAEAGPMASPPRSGTEVPVPAGNDIVAVVATNAEVGGRLFAAGVYLRARSLGQPVRRIADQLCTDEGGKITSIFPIRARVMVADGAHKPRVTDPAAQAVIDAAWATLGAPFLAYHWPAEAELFVLGDPERVSIALGQTGGVAGTRHYRRAEMLAAADSLVGTPTV